MRHLLHPSSSAAAAHEASRNANAANALYLATNPDALSAALDAINSARHVVGGGLLAEARARFG